MLSSSPAKLANIVPYFTKFPGDPQDAVRGPAGGDDHSLLGEGKDRCRCRLLCPGEDYLSGAGHLPGAGPGGHLRGAAATRPPAPAAGAEIA